MRFPGHENPFPILEGTFSGLGAVLPAAGGHMIDDAFVDPEISAGSGRAGGYIGTAVSDMKRRIFFGALMVALVAVLGRSAYLQIAEGAAYGSKAEGNRSRLISVPSERGVMYDRNGAPLVRNVPKYAAMIVPADLPTDESARTATYREVARILGIEISEVETALAAFARYPTTPVAVGGALTHEQASLIRIAEGTLPGVSLQVVARREYLSADTARSLAHVLGYQGRITEAQLFEPEWRGYGPSDLVGRTGLERQYESAVRGTFGSRRVEVDAMGRQKSVIAEARGEPGQNLMLAIDLELQKAAEKALRDMLRRTGKKRGSVIVSDPRNGEILAMVSEPSFDGNLFAQGISQEEYARLTNDPDHPLFPRAISASLPSGSVFKPVVAAAALDEHIVTASTAFLSSGGIRVGAWYFPDWKAGGHGMTDLAKALAESVNTWFYIVGGGIDDRLGLGVERIVEYARKFGLGAVTGIDLPGEGAGFLPSKEWKEEAKGERWYVGDTYHLAIGQGDLLVTPLQINMMTAAIANGGTLYRPHVVTATTDVSGARREVTPEVLATNVVSPEAITAVQRGMRQTVTAGSARSLGDLPIAVAAKTGTAQWHSTKSTHAWFTAFAPYENPEIAVTVAIEEGGEGSSAAAPVAKEIIRAYVAGR